MRYASILLLSALLLAQNLSAQTALPERTHDGRFGTQCYAWGRDASRELCNVSFYKLIATPEKYDGRLVSVVGFIVKIFDQVVLYPSKERYEADVPVEGIELIGTSMDPEDQKVMAHLSQGLAPVMVLAVFDGKYAGSGIPRLGAFRNIVGIRYVPRIPEGPAQ